MEAMMHRRGFSNIKVKMESIDITYHDAEDFYNTYDGFLTWIMDRYWTVKEKEICGPLVRDAIVDYMGKKFGVGKAFQIEKICMLVTGKKEDNATK